MNKHPFAGQQSKKKFISNVNDQKPNIQVEKKPKNTFQRWGSTVLLLFCLVLAVITLTQRYVNRKLSGQENHQTVSAYPYTLDQVNEVLDAQLIAWNDGNVAGFMQGYIKDSSVRFITNKRVKTSWQEITDSYKKNYPNKGAMGHLSFHRDEIRWINQTAGISQVIGRWEVIQTKQEDSKKSAAGEINHNVQSKSVRSRKTGASRNTVASKKTAAQDTLSGRFSLIIIGTSEGPKIQIDHTW